MKVYYVILKINFNRDFIREEYSKNYLKNSVGKTRSSTIGRFSNGKKDPY
jgi:hypothetical protein